MGRGVAPPTADSVTQRAVNHNTVTHCHTRVFWDGASESLDMATHMGAMASLVNPLLVIRVVGNFKCHTLTGFHGSIRCTAGATPKGRPTHLLQLGFI